MDAPDPETGPYRSRDDYKTFGAMETRVVGAGPVLCLSLSPVLLSACSYPAGTHSVSSFCRHETPSATEGSPKQYILPDTRRR